MTDAAITPASLLPCEGDKFLCTDNMALQKVLDIIYFEDATEDSFRISKPKYAHWLTALATRNACADVAATLPDGAYLRFDVAEDKLVGVTDSVPRARDAFEKAADSNIRLVTLMVLKFATTGESHGVAVVFDFKTCSLHVVDSEGFTDAAIYAQPLKKAVSDFVSVMLSYRCLFRVVILSQSEFACAPQCGLLDDAIVKSGSCAGWAYLFLYALCHWSACDLSNPHWYRCLATRLTGIAQPTNVQYYAVLLRFLTQLISTAKLEITSTGVVDRTTNMHVDPVTDFTVKDTIAYALQHEHGSVSAHDFLQWFRKLSAAAGRSPTKLPPPRVFVQIPVAWQKLACPLYVFTRHFGKFIMTHVNTWEKVTDDAFHEFRQLRPSVDKHHCKPLIILTDVHTKYLGSCVYWMEAGRVTVSPQMHHTGTRAAVLTAVLLAFLFSYAVVPQTTMVVDDEFIAQSIIDDAVPCLRVGAAQYKFEASTKLWRLSSDAVAIVLPPAHVHVIIPQQCRRALQQILCPLFAFSYDCTVFGMTRVNRWEQVAEQDCDFYQLRDPDAVSDKTQMLLTDANCDPLVLCSYDVTGSKLALTPQTYIGDAESATVLVAVVTAFVINRVLTHAPHEIWYHGYTGAAPVYLRVATTREGYMPGGHDSYWVLKSKEVPDTKRARLHE